MSADQDSYSKSGLLIFLISMVGTLFFFIYLVAIHPGVEPLDKIIEPSEKAAEQKQAKVKAVDPETADKVWVSTPGLIAAGAKVYAMNCATCHGVKGAADGIAATPETRNLITGDWKADGSSRGLFKTLQDGLAGTGMVSFKASVSPKKRWALVHFIRSITKNKIADDSASLEAFAKTAD